MSEEEQIVPEYILTCGQPGALLERYETKRLRRKCADHASAVRWAREAVRHEYGVTDAANQHPATPMALWLIEVRGRSVIWEHAPRAAAPMAGSRIGFSNSWRSSI
jgi:hypothetical protein